MRCFDEKAFLRGAVETDKGTLLEDFEDIGIVASDMGDGARKALKDFIKFVGQADCQATDGGPSPGRLSYEELLEISKYLNDIVQTLSGNFSIGITELARRLGREKNSAGKRRVL